VTRIVQLAKQLTARPEIAPPEGFRIRTFSDDSDIDRWLQLREQAFAREKVGVRRWTHADFVEEMIDKDWWREDRTWLAEADQGDVAGSITMAMRGRQIPVIHWLMVRPAWRRHGIAKTLVATLEAHAWDEGFREIRLETHDGWRSALRFYEASGYARL